MIGKTVAGLPPVTDEVRDEAVALLIEQCAALDPAGLARAGRHLHETLVSTPDVDDPAEQARIEADAQEDADQAHRLRSLSWRRHGDGSITGPVPARPARRADPAHRDQRADRPPRPRPAQQRRRPPADPAEADRAAAPRPPPTPAPSPSAAPTR